MEQKGWRFLQQNFCVQGGEIDLIFQDGDETVFVEVKARKNNSFGTPQDSITKAKIKHLLYAAKRYYSMTHKNWFTDPMRFDVIAIDISLEKFPKIEHFEHAFCFDDF